MRFISLIAIITFCAAGKPKITEPRVPFLIWRRREHLPVSNLENAARPEIRNAFAPLDSRLRNCNESLKALMSLSTYGELELDADTESMIVGQLLFVNCKDDELLSSLAQYSINSIRRVGLQIQGMILSEFIQNAAIFSNQLAQNEQSMKERIRSLDDMFHGHNSKLMKMDQERQNVHYNLNWLKVMNNKFQAELKQEGGNFPRMNPVTYERILKQLQDPLRLVNWQTPIEHTTLNQIAKRFSENLDFVISYYPEMNLFAKSGLVNSVCGSLLRANAGRRMDSAFVEIQSQQNLINQEKLTLFWNLDLINIDMQFLKALHAECTAKLVDIRTHYSSLNLSTTL